MQNFPLPYQNELLYSVIARAGVHMGLLSPKQILSEVFNNRKVIATFDLPCYIKSIAQHFPASKNITVEKLIYKHTLFAVYAPFVEESRRKRCLKYMVDMSQGATHLALGVAASKINRLSVLRYCPTCMQAQEMEQGEYYWDRRWQVSGANSCIEHGELVDAAIDNFGYQRHAYVDASPETCPAKTQNNKQDESLRISRQVLKLLDCSPLKSPSYDQWTSYYKQLAQQNGCGRGLHINYLEIHERVMNQWSQGWLEEHNLRLTDKQSCWLRAIFRKHRKAFSYLEHIIVLDSFLPKGWKITDVLKEVKKTSERIREKSIKPSCIPTDIEARNRYRSQWLELLTCKGIKEARLSGGGGIYAWLYRNDREWFLRVNGKNKLEFEPVNTRVDWLKRDRNTLRQLVKIKNLARKNCESPQMTKNWFLAQLERKSSIEKNLHKLPLISMFFEKYCEDREDFQIRRIRTAVNVLRQQQQLVTWKVLRLSGLSEERITFKAKMFLKQIMESNGKISN